uniref:ABC transporter domain-containing protein n=1 Tax=Haptolina ericina TaxID=156174 RepID=A0A7S3C3P7_9EUKA
MAGATKVGGEVAGGILQDDDPFVASLLREHEDWGSALSGGQRVKLEFIRSVFLPGACPDILLLDEAFAPLDPSSKLLIMRRLHTFCSTSLVLVIYHAEAREAEASQAMVDATVGSNAHAQLNEGTRSRGEAPNASADVCSAAGGSFFDGVVRFSEDGNVTFDQAVDLCT